MKIKRIELWHVAVPLPAPFRPSWIPGFRQMENRFDLVRICTESGLEGWSACQSMGRERAGLGALLGPYLLGERADDIPSIRQRMREMTYIGWRLGWLEPALWDILGKAQGKPVWQLLGGTSHAPVRLYCSTGQVRTGSERAREVEARLKEGFTAVKLRVHADDVEDDIAQIRQTRELVGDDVTLGVDVNQAWRVAVIGDAPKWDYERALAFCTAAQELGYSWVEEPLPMDDYDGLAKLRAATDIAITGGELNHYALPEFKVMLEKDCYDSYQPDAIFTGGIAETWQIIQEVIARGRKYSPHTWTNGFGFAVNLQLFLGTPFRDTGLLEYPYDPPGWVPKGRDGVLTEPWRHVEGSLPVPTRPGLGFEVDRLALSRYGRRYFVGSPVRVAVKAVLDRGLGLARELGGVRTARLEKRSAELDALFAGGSDPVSLALGRAPAAPAAAAPEPEPEPVEDADKV